MECVLCKSHLEESKVNHIVDLDGHIIIIKNVPARICKQCGEYFLENNIAVKIEGIIDEIVKNHAEILVVNYMEIAA